MSSLAGWVACPRCRADLRRGEDRVDCPDCDFVAYANPAPTACVVCTDASGRVLLARRAGEPFRGAWDLPGGFVQEDEHPLETVRRELREETSLEIEPGDFLGIWVDRYSEDDTGPGTLNLYWAARAAAGDAEAGDDVSELRWFERDELPPAGELAFHIGEVLATWQARFPSKG